MAGVELAVGEQEMRQKRTRGGHVESDQNIGFGSTCDARVFS